MGPWGPGGGRGASYGMALLMILFSASLSGSDMPTVEPHHSPAPPSERVSGTKHLPWRSLSQVCRHRDEEIVNAPANLNTIRPHFFKPKITYHSRLLQSKMFRTPSNLCLQSPGIVSRPLFQVWKRHLEAETLFCPTKVQIS